MTHTAITQAGNALVDLLKEHMVPDVIKTTDQIGLCSPTDRGDYSVGVCLYDIRECGELQSHSMISLDSRRQKYPSIYVDLFYMITAYSDGDIRFRSMEEQNMLGKIIQILNDHTVIRFPEKEGEPEDGIVCSVSLRNLSMEEKMRISNIPDMGYKVSLFYEVGPIAIESGKERYVTRTVDLQFSLEEYEKHE